MRHRLYHLLEDRRGRLLQKQCKYNKYMEVLVYRRLNNRILLKRLYLILREIQVIKELHKSMNLILNKVQD